MSVKHSGIVGWCVALSFLAGCTNKQARIMPPTINPVQAGQDAIKEYDKDGDGAISGSELDDAPALKSALSKIDKNGDGKITADEIAARIEQWQATKVAIMSLPCRITLDEAPLKNATVKFIPEKFLGPAIQEATGTTTDQGYAVLTIANPPRPGVSGMNVGLYRVEITKDDGGKQSVPARYNTNTKLGQEVAQDVDAVVTGVQFKLTSK